MRILHVLNSADPENGGTFQAVRDMSAHQAALGHKVTIVSTGNGSSCPSGRRAPKSSQGEIWTVFPVQWKAWRWSYAMQKAMPGLIKETNIVHLHTMWEFPVYYGHALSLKLGKPYVISPHGMLERRSLEQQAFKKQVYLRLAGQSILTGAGAVHFTSRPEFERSRLNCMENKAFVIPLGVTMSDLDDRNEKDFYEKFPELVGNRFILFLGRLHPKKRPDLAIRAFQKISWEFKNHYFLMAGPGAINYILKLKRIVEKYNLKDRVLFPGMLGRSLALMAYRKADFFVLPSAQESFGLSVAEAAASACPVIVSPEVNLSEEIQKTHAGIVCLAQEHDLAEAMRRLLLDPHLRKQMGENGRRLVLGKFSWNKIILEYIEMYKSILNKVP